jgi:Ulp1 family protease
MPFETNPVTVELKNGILRDNKDELNVYWISDLNLTMTDKEILENNLWLTDKHMRAASKILKEQFNINGFQDTTKTPFYQENSKTWNTENRFLRQSAPSVQIHFDGNNHWTTSLQSPKEPDTVYYVDSLGDNIKHLKLNIQIQLSQIYHNNQDVINVKVPRCQQQPNGNDCGLFAIANAVEFCFNTGNVNFNYAFKIDELRSHLADCLENRKFTKFPKQFSRDRASTFSGITKQISFDLRCSCRMPEFIDNMISCNNKKCKTWFHQSCIGLNNGKKSIKNWKWQCLICNKVNGQ